jgi:hypothetical protein
MCGIIAGIAAAEMTIKEINTNSLFLSELITSYIPFRDCI